MKKDKYKKILEMVKDVEYQNIPYNEFMTKSAVDNFYKLQSKKYIKNIFIEYYGGEEYENL